ncbi:MAG: metal-dependent transcriptional regulator [Flavobacteriales bacterium]|nr:metal-dependent transcriptional regulator [Flavobacteriales bacterium]
MPQATVTEENYLKALYYLVDEQGEITISDLSREMGVSKPTSNSMIKSLSGKGLVAYEKYKPLKLTETGRRMAALVIRKHRLTEMFLVEQMGFGWEEVHEVAEQIEHIRSEKFFDRMDDLLGHPTIDPHGSPIPDKSGNVQERSYAALSTCASGDQVRMVALNQSSKDFLKYLNSKSLHLGTRIEVLRTESFDGSVEVRYEGHPRELLSRTVADLILIESAD